MNTPIPTDLIEGLKSARSVAVLTGAGVSAESGIPTFRDALAGLWSNFKAEDLATPEAFARNPELVARWYDDRRTAVARCRPNAGHVALAALQRKLEAAGRKFTLITQNVDGLHQSAGSTSVIELHGSIRKWRCTTCGVETDEVGPAFTTCPPRCRCGGVKRPAVVWFGEHLPAESLRAAEDAVADCDVMLSIGTSGLVYPAAGLIDLAPAVAEINPAETQATPFVRWSIRGASASVLPEMVKRLRA